MTRLAVPFNLPAPVEPLRNLARTFSAIHSNVGGVNVQCSICKARGRANSKLVGKANRRGPILCADCQRAS